jgi:2-polyprenyl-3-methyl-5-hydroxy-6-metoxy-1,4-benzoquinol methylase
MLITEQEFLEYELNHGIGMHNDLFKDLARNTVAQIENLPVVSVLDYGAGTGVYSDAYFKAGYDIKAFEIFKSHREYMAKETPYIEIIDEPITTDLLNFIETAEHMTDKELDYLFSKIEPNYILFSSTSQRVPGFDEQWGHINIKEQDEWDSYFKTKGYSKIKDLSLPTTWSKLYGKD